MAQAQLTEEQYRLVAAVAEREGWTDLAAPALEGGPRTLAEQEAVLRFTRALPAARARSRAVRERNAKLVMAAVGAAGLLVCWMVSPERTAAALLMVGVFCLVALRRRGRRAAGTRRNVRRLSW
jgi:hypothetical protein